jgi:hypothetical protein
MTGPYRPGTLMPGQHVIQHLWSQVDELPDDQWPAGVKRPRIPHDFGTAGFPDAAGLYWASGQPMPDFPFGGVMFVGHNTDAEGKHASRRSECQSPGEPGNPVMQTWKKLYKLFELAAFNHREMFFTNIYVGLKAGDNQEGSFQGARTPHSEHGAANSLTSRSRS